MDREASPGAGPNLSGLPRRRTEGGFTLVGLMVMVAIMAIFMGVAVQTVTFQMRREKEAELIFRGEQYVEAIRIFKHKYGRYPMSLKEIWEAKPHVIRKKWKDPITDSTNWGLVFLGQSGNQVGGGTPLAGGSGSLPTPTPAPSPTEAPEGGGGGIGGAGGQGARGPIIGVYSRSTDDSIKIYKGRTRYCDWKFVLEESERRRAPIVPTNRFGVPPVPTSDGLRPTITPHVDPRRTQPR